MLKITIPETEAWDEINNEFITVKDQTLVLEHSLVSISKWESKWCKPFLGNSDKTDEEVMDYIRTMTITKNVDPNIYRFMSAEHIKKINDYILAPMTATWFSNENNSKKSSEQITSELIYYWMIAFNIPVEFQKWHLNKLLTLIRVCEEKNKPPKKMSKRDIMSRNAMLNAARKKKLNTNG